MSDDIKRAVVVGATSGIGKEVVRELTRRGWQVGIAGRRQTVLQQMQAKNLNIVATERIDVTEENAVESLKKLIGKTGGIDLYFHSSGIGFQNRELDLEKELSTVSTNAMGVTRLVNVAFHYFEDNPQKQGTIAVISSIAGTKGLGPAPAYSASKRFVNHYLSCLRQLCRIRKTKNIQLLDIRPGFVKTPLLDDGNAYPMQLDPKVVANKIVRAIERRKTVVTIDWKYRLLVFFWRLIPTCIWERIRL